MFTLRQDADLKASLHTMKKRGAEYKRREAQELGEHCSLLLWGKHDAYQYLSL